MPSWIFGALAIVSTLGFVAALGMYAVAEQQNARLRRALTTRHGRL